MKIEKLKTIHNKPIPVISKNKISTSQYMMKLHTLMSFIGHRGSGKTNTAVLLAKQLQDERAINHIFIISPTYYSNPIFQILNIPQENIYEDIDNVLTDIQEIQDRVKELRNEYDFSILYRKVYNKLLKKGEDYMNDDELQILEKGDFLEPDYIEFPKCLLIVDDCSHSKLYSQGRNSFTNLCLRHRHIAKGTGISIFMLVQNWKSGIPKSLRQNLCQIIIYKTHDKSQIKDMYNEILGGVMNEEKFNEIYNYATNEPHNFLFIDLNPKIKKYQYRKNFNEALL